MSNIKASTRTLIGQCFRVVYRNPLDGKMRVLIGGLTQAEANAVQSKWGNPNERFFYMGQECAIELCDGTPDGSEIAS